jgi:hypothetical protein
MVSRADAVDCPFVRIWWADLVAFGKNRESKLSSYTLHRHSLRFCYFNDGPYRPDRFPKPVRSKKAHFMTVLSIQTMVKMF